MKIIEPYVEIMEPFDGPTILRRLERAIRTCYKSEAKIGDVTAPAMVKAMIKSGHHSTLEHEKLTVRFVCDRGVTHELVRHRIASYSQESTRYCNYSKEKFGNIITVIRPVFWPTEKDEKNDYRGSVWYEAMDSAESHYMQLIEDGASPQEARSVLPNSLKTEIVTTMNMREWRHFFTLRCSAKAHPQMRQVAIPLLLFFCAQGLDVLFGDIPYDPEFDVADMAEVRWADHLR